MNTPDRYDREEVAHFRDRLAPFAGRLDPASELLGDAVARMVARARRRFEDSQRQLGDRLVAAFDPTASRLAVPSLSIVRFASDDGAVPGGLTLTREDGRLRPLPPEDGPPVEFRITQETTVWPLTVSAATARNGVLELVVTVTHRDPEVTFADLPGFDVLRLFVAGAPAVAYPAFEAVATSAEVTASVPNGPSFPVMCMPVGYRQEETLLPETSHALSGDRLLSEFMLFPSKFLFIDLAGLQAAAGRSRVLLVRFCLKNAAPAWGDRVSATTFLTNCAPVVNLVAVSTVVETPPFRADHPVIADPRRPDDVEWVCIDSVTASDGSAILPLNKTPVAGHPQAYWGVVRAAADPCEAAQAVSLRLAPGTVGAALPSRVRVIGQGSHGSRPAREPSGRWTLLDGRLTASAVVQPTWPLRPPVSQEPSGEGLTLSLHALGDHEDQGGALLRAFLAGKALVHWTTDSGDVLRREQLCSLISGVAGVRADRSRLAGHGLAGRHVTVSLGGEACPGGSGYMFGLILDRFFGSRAGLCSFTRVTVKTRSGDHTFPARSGEEVLE